jgi:serine protease
VTHRRSFAGLAALVIAAGTSAVFASKPAQAQTFTDPGDAIVHDDQGHEEIVVDFDDSTSREQIAADARAAGITLLPNSFMEAQDHLFRALVPAGEAESYAARIRALPGVTGAEPNVRMHVDFTPNDPQLGDQWHMQTVRAPAAWNFTCGQGVTVAVVDTGVACENHGEFTRVMDMNGTRCLPGYDFTRDREHANDDQGHGTHVAGTIAQTTNNGFGVAGLAYCATILPVKVLTASGSGTLADVAEGIRYAADHGAQVINLSLGGGGRSKVMGDAVTYARRHGAVVVCAAGNNGRRVESPANETDAFAVSATDPGDQIAYFSSRGPEVDIAAPGVNVLQQTICDRGRNRCEQFAAWSGTSMAAPHVAGVAALVAGLGVSDPAAIESILRATARAPEHGSRDRELYGAGVVNAQAAVEHVQRMLGIARVIALALAIAAAVTIIRKKKGTLASPLTWAGTALLTSTGLFFLPWLVPHFVPGIDLAMRPVGDWSVLLGLGVHKWLPFANAGVVLALVALGFGRKKARAPIGGFALGTAAYLASQIALGFVAAPLGGLLRFVWIAVNAGVCFWVARIALDEKTAA